MVFLVSKFRAAIAILALIFVTHAGASTPQKASVFVQPASQIELADKLIYPGRVKSRIHSTSTSEIEGQIIKINKKLGDPVKRGEVVLVVQNTDPVYRFAPVKIRSLADGFITSMEVSLQAKVERSQKLFTVTDPKDLLIEAEIPSADLRALKKGMIGEFNLNFKGTEGIKVSIEGLSPIVDVRTGTATAEFKPLEKLDQLNQGHLGQVTIKTRARKGIVIPESALVYRDDKPYVRIVEEGKIKKVSIELGARMGESYEVVSGLSEDLKVVIRSSRFVPDGEEVTVETPSENL